MAKPGAVLLLLALVAYCCLVARAFVPAAPLTTGVSRARFARAATALEAVKDAKSPEEFDKVSPVGWHGKGKGRSCAAAVALSLKRP